MNEIVANLLVDIFHSQLLVNFDLFLSICSYQKFVIPSNFLVSIFNFVYFSKYNIITQQMNSKKYH